MDAAHGLPSRARPSTVVAMVLALIVATLAFAAAPVETSAATCPGGNYTVVAGDGWTTIAKKLRIYTRELLSLNNATLQTVLVPGKVLCLPLSPLVTTPTTTAAATPSTAATATTVAARTCTGATYKVVANDGWYAIADKLDVTVLSLFHADNASTATKLFPGMVLCVTGGATTTTTTTSSTVAVAPPIPTAAPGSIACTGATYTVVRNDGWRRIASKLGVGLIDLLTANQATVATELHPSDVLCVPNAAAPSTAQTVTTTTAAQTPTVPGRCVTDALTDGTALCVDQANRTAWGLTFVAGRTACPTGSVQTIAVTYGSTTESVCVLRRMAARTGRGTFEATGTGCSSTGAGRYLVTGKARSLTTRTSDRTPVQVNDVVFFATTQCTWATSVHEVIDDTAAANNDLTRGNNSGWINLLPADSDWVFDFLDTGDTIRLVGTAK